MSDYTKYEELVDEITELILRLEEKSNIDYSSGTDKGYIKAEVYTEVVGMLDCLINECEEED